MKCKNCGNDSLETFIEDKQFFYRCGKCDWIRVESTVFYITGWYIQIKQATAPIDILVSLLEDKDIAKFLKPRLRGFSHVVTKDGEFDMSEEYLLGEIEIAKGIYLRQMSILAVTYAELIVKDFFKCLFTVYPSRMNIVSGDFVKKFQVAKKTSDKDEQALHRIVMQATDGAWRKFTHELLDELLLETNIKPILPIVIDLQKMKSQRNKIVHEWGGEDISAITVINEFGQLIYLLYLLTEIGLCMDLPIWDELGLVDDMRSQAQ